MIALELEQFIDTRSFDALGELMETISMERFSTKTLGVSYRTICHWDDKGIIRYGRTNADANRKYSFVDYIWVKVVGELRSFGVELPIIQKIVSEIYSPIPVKDIFSLIADNQESLDIIKSTSNEDKAEFLEFLKSGEFNTADFSNIENKLNYLHMIVAEIIATKKPVSILVFKNGDWLPFILENKHLYSEDILYKIEYESHVCVSLTNLVFNFIMEENMKAFSEEVNLLTIQELKVLNVVVEGKFKKITVLFKSKKHPPLEIKKSKSAKDELVKVFRKKNFKDFIVTDAKGNEYRIREEKQQVDLSIGVKTLLSKDENEFNIDDFEITSTDDIID